MNIKKYIVTSVIIAITCILSVLYGNEAIVANAPKAVENGQRFEITFTISGNGNISDFNPPKITDFQYFGSGQESSFINGSVSVKYIYYYMAVNEGTFTIEPASVKIKNKVYKSDPITVEVVKSSVNQSPVPSNQQKQQNNLPDTEDSKLILKTFVNKSDVYNGEQVVVSIKLFCQYDIKDLKSAVWPSYSGFFTQDLDGDNRLTEETINGKRYYTVVLQRKLLFPTQTGEIKIDPATLKIVIAEYAGSRFGFPQYRYVQKEVKSNPVTINVKPLPYGKPLSFTGAVGDFTLKGTVNKTEAETNDALTFKVTLQGKGNIKLSEPPQLKLPPDFELYEPKITQNISNSVAGQSGTKIFEYLAIPRHAGEYTVEPIEFTYFDISNKVYKTLRTPKFNLSISKGNDTLTTPVLSGLSKEEIKFLGSDILFIKTRSHLKKQEIHFFRSMTFYLIYPVLLLIMILIIIIRRKRIEKNKNIWLVKNKKANKKAKARLKLAYKFLRSNEKEKFYEELSKALWGYLGDKLSISPALLTKDNAKESLISYNVENDTLTNLFDIIDECEYARYAPPSEAQALNEVYGKSVKIISTLEQKLR